MRKYITIIFLLFGAFIANAQDTNVHVSFGNNYTVGAGVDYRHNKNLVSADTEISKMCKNPGGCGHQYDVKAVYARYLNDEFAIQGGVTNTYYQVDLFDKNAFGLLGGIRYNVYKNKAILEVNYRHDLTSENKVKAVEAQVTGYLPKHIFVRARAKVFHFRDYYHEGRFDSNAYIAIGLHF